MPELLSFIITAILVLYIIRSLIRIFLPMLFQNVVNKAQQANTAAATKLQSELQPYK